jgi:spermidine/putrescine transport system permease protein
VSTLAPDEPPVAATAFPRGRDRRWVPFVLAAPAALFMAAFLIAPTAHLGLTSFWTTSYFRTVHAWNLHQYSEIMRQPGVLETMIRSIWTGLLVAVVTTATALPVAFYIRFRSGPRKVFALAIVITAMFSSYLVRIYAWRTLMGSNGAVNWALTSSGLTDHGLSFLFYNRFGVVITLVHIYIPFAVIILLATLEGVELDVLEAGRTLGARGHQMVRWVILPMIGKGLFVAFALTFILSASDYVTPQFVGGTSGAMTGTFVMLEMTQLGDYSHGAALSLVLLLVLVAMAGGAYLVGRLVRLADR